MNSRKTIAVMGTGYVGLVTGACFAEIGHRVTCIDIDRSKIDSLNKGQIPIFEPGLEKIVKQNIKNKNLTFTTTLTPLDTSPTIYFIAVGTPTTAEDSADTQYVFQVAKEIGKNLNISGCIIVNKSTVPVGTAQKVKSIIQYELDSRDSKIKFLVVSNPEFLKEGNAIKDFFSPDRIVIGSENHKAAQDLKELYLSFINDENRIILMGEKEAELTKYVANSMLATKISFINEIAHLCEVLGVDVEDIKKGIGSDSRIGNSFINPGCGYGGSCFPKDVKELIHLSYRNGLHPYVIEAVNKRNDIHKMLLVKKMDQIFSGDLQGIKIALWGLTFKPETDDMREAPSIPLIQESIRRGATVKAYDPVAGPVAKALFSKSGNLHKGLEIVDKQYDVIEGADVLILVTEWKCFINPDWLSIKEKMRNKIVLDGRNQYEPSEMESLGFLYWGIGRKNRVLDHFINNTKVKIREVLSDYLQHQNQSLESSN